MRQGIRMELEFSMESRIDFNGKVSVEGDIEVVVESKARLIKRTIGDFAKNYERAGLKYFYI